MMPNDNKRVPVKKTWVSIASNGTACFTPVPVVSRNSRRSNCKSLEQKSRGDPESQLKWTNGEITGVECKIGSSKAACS